jgi:hypothetical protein
VSSDDDSTPPSQRATPPSAYSWSGPYSLPLPQLAGFDELAIPEPPTDAERAAARRILLGTPIASPIGSHSSSNSAASFTGGHIPDIFIPLNLVQDARHFAYAILAFPVLCPFDHIRSAMELVDGVPPFTFAATSSATALLVFTSPEAREQAMSFSPFGGGGIPVTLLRPEDSDNRAFTAYDVLLELRVRHFPLEL